MRTSKLLHSLSLHFHGRFSPATVAPLPERTAFDEWLHSELDDLRVLAQQSSQLSTKFITRALEVSIAAHDQALEYISKTFAGIRTVEERAWIKEYMEDVVELLDACKNLRSGTEIINDYTSQIASSAHYLAGGQCDRTTAAVERARRTLRSSEVMERSSYSELEKCHSRLRKLGERAMTSTVNDHLPEVLRGAKSVALLVCRMLSIGLSFRSKRRLQGNYHTQFASSWSDSLLLLHREIREEAEKTKSEEPLMEEVKEVVLASRCLRGVLLHGKVNGASKRVEMGSLVSSTEKVCKELGDGVELIERRVNLLYKRLIAIRMALMSHSSS